MSKPGVRFGILGCGTIAAFHAKGIMESPSAELTAVCDVDLARAKDFAQGREVGKTFSDIREMAACAVVDAVLRLSQGKTAFIREPNIPACPRSGKARSGGKALEITTERIDRLPPPPIRAKARWGRSFRFGIVPISRKSKRVCRIGLGGNS